MKYLLIAALLLTGCKSEYVVYGDSITSPADGWPNVVNHWRMSYPDAGFPYMMNGAVEGTRLIDFDFPDHIKQKRHWDGSLSNERGMILAYGTNDAGSGVPLADFEEKLRDVVQMAADRHLEVTCILAYDVPQYADTGPYRAIQKEICPKWVDITLDHRDTPDGLHLGPKGQNIMAREVLEQLGQ